MPQDVGPSVPDVSTHLEAATGDSLAMPRRRLALPLILGFAVLLAIGGAILMSGSTTPRVVIADAAPDTALIVQAPDASIAQPDAEPVEPDAAVGVADARPITADAKRVTPDAQRAIPDAAVVAQPPDAAVDSGSGKLIVRHHPSRTSYLDVFVDGTPIGKTPSALQFEVLADRMRSEYDLPCHFEATSFEVARWVDADDPKMIKRFADANRDNCAEDHSGATVFLARNDWQLNRAKLDWADLRFLQTREQSPLTTASA